LKVKIKSKINPYLSPRKEEFRKMVRVTISKLLPENVVDDLAALMLTDRQIIELCWNDGLDFLLDETSWTVERKIRREKHPTVDEVKAYCAERGAGIDAEKWFDHYVSNGWKVGQNPMRDWKAAVRTWERSGFNGNGNGSARRADCSMSDSPAAKVKLQQQEYLERKAARL
jgi:hypothetical protein